MKNKEYSFNNNNIIITDSYNLINESKGLEHLCLYTDTIIFDSNKSIGNLPNNFKKIIFTNKFTRIPDDIPTHITDIEFDNSQDITLNFLHENIKSIKIKSYNNIDITNLPNSLEKLIILGNVNKTLECIPKNVKCLQLEINLETNKILKTIPPTVNFLILNDPSDTNLRYMYLNSNINNNTTEWHEPQIHIPNSITKLKIIGNLCRKFILPKKLTNIYLDYNTNIDINELVSQVDSIKFIGLSKHYKSTQYYKQSKYKKFVHFYN